MKNVSKRPIKFRKKWPINPRTKVEESGCVYKRPKEKRKISKAYEPDEIKT